MATYRGPSAPNTSEKTLSPAQGGPPPGPSDTSPAVPSDVIYKLLGFSVAMIVLPIGSYFATVHTVFNGSPTYAGAFAALMANIVLIGYVIVAMKEDSGEPVKVGKIEGKKGQ